MIRTTNGRGGIDANMNAWRNRIAHAATQAGEFGAIGITDSLRDACHPAQADEAISSHSLNVTAMGLAGIFREDGTIVMPGQLEAEASRASGKSIGAKFGSGVLGAEEQKDGAESKPRK